VTAAEAGFGKAFQPLLKNLKQGNLPNCMRRVLAKPGILTIKDPASTCGDCPLANIYKERGVFSSRLEHDGKIYGILTVSFPADYILEKKEGSLFEEIVGDIAYALHHIELEEEHKKAEEALRQRTHDLGERVKELSCLFEIDEIIRKGRSAIEDVLEKTVRIIPPSWQYPEITGSCVTFENKKYKTKNFKETKWMQKEDIIVNAKKVGLVEVCYLEEKPEDYEGPFLKEERDLIKGVVERLAQFIEHKRAEEALKKSEAKYRTLLENLQQKIFLMDKNFVYVSCNENYARDLKIKPEKIIGKTDYDFYPKQLAEKYRADDKRIMESGETEDIEEKYLQEGQETWVHTVKTPVKDEKGTVVGILGIFWDITEKKRAADQIKASLKEKEVLLQEVHHRVKNNMQIISSLFNLQSGRIKDKQAFEIFKSSQNRVRSMALIHERLYQSKDLTRVDFAEYSQSLATHLFSSYGINPDVIKFYINIKDVFLDINTAIPCSLIINELVSNSLKYAFPGNKKGEIKIAANPPNKNEVELIVSDNGVGLPKKMDFRKTDSLGLHLVNLLAEDQLHGNIKLDRTKGTSFHIRFKVKR
jgi:PAS domain S-box-containing protein